MNAKKEKLPKAFGQMHSLLEGSEFSTEIMIQCLEQKDVLLSSALLCEVSLWCLMAVWLLFEKTMCQGWKAAK